MSFRTDDHRLPVCPRCGTAIDAGEVHDDLPNEAYEDGGRFSVECVPCGQPFWVQASESVSYTYSSADTQEDLDYL